MNMGWHIKMYRIYSDQEKESKREEANKGKINETRAENRRQCLPQQCLFYLI